MHLIIRTDGRSERVGWDDPYDDRRTAYHSLNQTFDFGREFRPQHCLPIRAGHPDGTDGDLTLWIGEPSLNGVGLRNIPAALLAAQWGVPARVLCGPVVITSSGSIASAFVEDMRWKYVESLVEDITRAINGLPVTSHVNPAWPQAIRLAAAVLRDAPRPEARGLTGDAAVNYLMAELGFAGGGA
jgi:hypothetical protein